MWQYFEVFGICNQQPCTSMAASKVLWANHQSLGHFQSDIYSLLWQTSNTESFTILVWTLGLAEPDDQSIEVKWVHHFLFSNSKQKDNIHTILIIGSTCQSQSQKKHASAKSAPLRCEPGKFKRASLVCFRGASTQYTSWEDPASIYVCRLNTTKPHNDKSYGLCWPMKFEPVSYSWHVQWLWHILYTPYVLSPLSHIFEVLTIWFWKSHSGWHCLPSITGRKKAEKGRNGSYHEK